MTNKPSVFVAILAYGPENQESTLQLLRPLIRSTFPKARSFFLVVDNAISNAPPQPLGEDCIRIAGENSVWEFSGLDHGIEWLEKNFELSDEYPFFLANDTLPRIRKQISWYRLKPRKLRPAIQKNRVVARLDAFPEAFLFGERLEPYPRFCFLGMKYGVLRKIRPLAIRGLEPQIFSSDPKELFKSDGPLSISYQKNIRAHLSGNGETDFGKWYRAEPLTDENFTFFKLKARSIVIEHLLGIRIRKLGLELEDYKQWLTPMDRVIKLLCKFRVRHRLKKILFLKN